MAVRIDASSKKLQRSALGLEASPYTFMGWVYMDVDKGTFTYWLGADDLGGSFTYSLIGFGGDGITSEFVTEGTGITGPTIGLGAWYWFCGVRDPSGPDTFYYSLEGDPISEVVGDSVRDILATWTFTVGSDGFDEFVNGRVGYVKVWTAALTDVEVAAERLFSAAIKTSDVWAVYPLIADGSDTSGNGRHLTEIGAPSYVDGPSSVDAGGGGVNGGVIASAYYWFFFDD